MPVILVHQGPTLTQDRYEEAVKMINRWQSFHCGPRPTGPSKGSWSTPPDRETGGFRVVDLWESEEAVEPIRHDFGADPSGSRRDRHARDLRRPHVRLGR